ncbi:MAG: hypothetical protein ACKVT2_02815 [Saprospiraceae bacterium]
MRTLLSIDEAISVLESIISKNRHSLTEEELRCLFEVIALLKEYKDEGNLSQYLNPQIIQKAVEVLLRFLLEDDIFNKLKDFFS